jgi:hypothetical protein
MDILVVYKDIDGEYDIKKFEDRDSLGLREFLDSLRFSENKKLLWIIEGRFLHVTPDGDFY